MALFKNFARNFKNSLLLIASMIALTVHVGGQVGAFFEAASECKADCLEHGAVDYEFTDDRCFCIVGDKAVNLDALKSVPEVAEAVPLCDAGACESAPVSWGGKDDVEDASSK